MPQLNCIIIDDDPVVRHILKDFIDKTTGLELQASFENPYLASVYEGMAEADIIFLDIETPVMTGIEFLEQYTDKAQIVITTSKKEYAVVGFDNDVTDFLLKPMTYERFLKSINKITQLQPNEDQDEEHLFLKNNRDYFKINLNELLYIQAASEYLIIYTKKGKFMIYSNMRDILKKLNDNFMQVHRSYIIALDKIETFSKKHVVIDSKDISVSKTYSKQLFDVLGV